METMHSEYLNVDFEVTKNVLEDGGRELVTIPHNVLEDIVLNKIPSEYQIRYDFELSCCTETHAVVRCTMYDCKGRRVQTFGESLLSDDDEVCTLKSPIAKGIPATMAQIRAFDRAAIRYLNFPDKNVYSREEISIKASKPKAAAAAIKAQPVKGDEVKFEKAEAPAKTKAPAPKADEAVGDMIISLGKFAGENMSIKDICSNPANAKWVDWACNKQVWPTDGEKAQVESIKHYLKECD